MRPSKLRLLAMIVGLAVASAMAENPLAKPVTQRPFAGNFSGDKISLEMKWDASQEAYTGWLTFQGNRYACGGLVDNSVLSGQFVADGTKYPFSISINNNGITLTSDGQNYPMKREQPAQPAAGGNPLGGVGTNPQPPANGGGALPPGGLPGDHPQQPAAGPAWLKPGVRLTFWSGSASIPGATTVLSPDDNGDWKTPDGRKFSEQNNPGAGGYGYQQLTIASVNNNVAVVDARNFLINPENQNVTGILSSGYILPANNGGDYWTDPRQLAQMQNGPQGAVRIFRGPYQLGNRQYNVVRITTRIDTGWTQHTYDAETGLMLSTGSSTMGQSQMLPGPNGQGTFGGATNNITQGFFVNLRELTIPWIGQRGTPDLAQLRGMEFGGTYVTEVPQIPSVQWGFGMRWEIGKIDEWSVQMRQSTAIDYRNGQQPQPNVADRVGSLSTLWIDPQILGRLHQGQVLDEDPYTKKRLSVAGVQNGSVIFAEESPAENAIASYDIRTGQINGMQLKQQIGLGVNTISLQRTK